MTAPLTDEEIGEIEARLADLNRIFALGNRYTARDEQNMLEAIAALLREVRRLRAVITAEVEIRAYDASKHIDYRTSDLIGFETTVGGQRYVLGCDNHANIEAYEVQS